MRPDPIRRIAQHARQIVIALVFCIIFISLGAQPVSAGALTSAKDTLGTSRPSVSTAIGSAITAGDSTINVTSNAGININDSIVICAATCATTETKTVGQLIGTTKLVLTAPATNSYASGTVYLKENTVHTITFTTRSGVTAGSFLVTLPVAASNMNDGLPDSTGFDFNSLANSDISLSATGGTIGTPVITPASGTISIPFTGTIAASVAATITIGSTNKLINPTKTAAAGTADTWTVRVDEKDNGSNIIDTVQMKVGTIEAVIVTATVAPSFSFSIAGVSSGTSMAGTTASVTTTATTVPFGTISTATSYTAANLLTVSTNSDTGYTVTAQEDGSLRKPGGSTSITDYSTSAADNGNTANGFGYSEQNSSGTDATITYNQSGATFFSQGFTQTPTTVSVMTNTGPVSGSAAYIIYRVRVPATQSPGDYQNMITYIATAKY